MVEAQSGLSFSYSEVIDFLETATRNWMDVPPLTHANLEEMAVELSRFVSDQAPRLSSFQKRVHPWMLECFGEMITGDREERNHRFLEESLELVQSTGCTVHEAHQLVDYVFGRSVGEPYQEVGGVMVTLAALCLANALDMHKAGETELARVWTKVEAIRAKHAAKPKHSPLPGYSTPSTGSLAIDRFERFDGSNWKYLRPDQLQNQIDGGSKVRFVYTDGTTAEIPATSSQMMGLAADAYVAEQGIEHSGGIIERAFEAGARWAVDQSLEVVDNYIGGGRSFVMRKLAALSAREGSE